MKYRYLTRILLLIAVISLTFSCSKDDEQAILLKDSQQISFENGAELTGVNNTESGYSLTDPWNRSVIVASHDITTQWMDLFLSLERYASGMRPNASARAIAYIGLAAYETALPFLPQFRSNEGLLEGLELPNSISRDMDIHIALNTCYALSLDHFLLQMTDHHKEQMLELEQTLLETYSTGVDQKRIENSIQWGQTIASAIIHYSQSDVEAENQILEPQPLSYEPPAGLGYWTYSAEPERALFPYWENTRCFVIPPDETTTIPPIEYSKNPVYPFFKQMLEVVQANDLAKKLNGEQLWIAEFWSDDVEGLMFSPPSRQLSIATQLVKQHESSLGKTLLLNLKLGFALNDAAVAAWKYKYEYMVMRPSVFIKEYIDPNFQTNLFRLVAWPNPSFPSYPSGHSTFASAAGGLFIDFFGNETTFTDRSHEGRTAFRGMPRTWETLEDMAKENAYSRIPLGVHMRMDCDEGYRLGYEISDAINAYNLSERKQLDIAIGR